MSDASAGGSALDARTVAEANDRALSKAAAAVAYHEREAATIAAGAERARAKADRFRDLAAQADRDADALDAQADEHRAAARAAGEG